MSKRFFIIIGIVVVGLMAAMAVIKTAPKPVKKPLAISAPLVEVSTLTPSVDRPSWQGGASVNANKSVKLVAQVSGQIVKSNAAAIPGSFVKKGTELVNIDDANYRLVFQQKKAKVIQAQASLDMELAQVENAKKDYQRSGMKLNPAGKALALRQPQLASAKAALAIANADLNKAKLDLSRTRLSMPFDGHILAQHLTEGAFVNSATAVFEILDTRQYWLEVKVPQSFIAILDVDYPVQLSLLGSDETRAAKILSILPQVSALDRQARVLISIEDPLSLQQSSQPIRYNDYVEVTLFGQELKGVSLVDTDALLKSGLLWVVDKQSKLQARKVEVLYSGRKKSWVKVAMEADDQVLLSSLDSPVSGMKVRLKESIVSKQVPDKTTAQSEVSVTEAGPK